MFLEPDPTNNQRSDLEHNHRAETERDSFFGLYVQKTAQPANFSLFFYCEFKVLSEKWNEDEERWLVDSD